MFKIKKFFLFLILILACGLRLYKIDIPLADHHSWRQADTAAVARNFIKEGWDFFRPKIDNMTSLHSGKPNDQRLFLVEPPVYNSLVAGIYRIFGIHIKYARLVSVIFSLGAIAFLYLITANYLGDAVGLLAAFFLAVLPYSIFYSRVVLPEPMIVFFTLGMFYFCIKWLETNSILHFSSFIFLSTLSFSQKTFPLFFLLPLFFLIFNKFGLRFLKQPRLYIWLAISFLPLVFWRWWINHFPEGVPASFWLFNQGNIRFTGAFFYWIFAKRIGELISGYWGLPFLVLGIIQKPKKEGWFFHFWLLSIFIYIAVFAAGNVTHDYYQIPLVPIFCIFLAKGANLLLFESREIFNKTFCYLLFAICFLFMTAFSWYEVRNFYNIQGGVDLAGAAVDKLTPKDALVLTGDSNDATLLYNTNRWGWTGGYASNFPNSPEVIEKIKSMDGSVYVTTKFDKKSDFGKYMISKYQLLEETNQYVIFSLITNH
ncbi:MAG TPA: glycosyltransferase family 39 protein [Patescibacteria group bacterium]|nr:glycosyltransferase family 39 protein [Patescibacteria group bacterium]